jgi:hypothetical protein
MKKKFEVELKYTSYVCVTIEAESQDEAEQLAYREVESGADRAWETESIQEVKE